jgi:hypothetical protein
MNHQFDYKVLGVTGFLEGTLRPGDVITLEHNISQTTTSIWVSRGDESCEVYVDAIGPRRLKESLREAVTASD